MSRPEVDKCVYVAKVLALGLFSAQVLATIQVYLSNADLHRTLVVIKAAGYLNFHGLCFSFTHHQLNN